MIYFSLMILAYMAVKSLTAFIQDYDKETIFFTQMFPFSPPTAHFVSSTLSYDTAKFRK